MTSWTDVETAAPDLAAAVRQAFAARKHATMATIRRDGAPRISGTEVEFDDDGNVYIGIMAGARRAADLRRDPRIAIHSPTVDPPQDAPEAWVGEAKIAGRAIEVDPERFRIDLEQAVFIRVAPGGQELEITIWSPDAGVLAVRRA